MGFTRRFATILLAVVLGASPASAQLRLPTTKDSFEKRVAVLALQGSLRPAPSAQRKSKAARGIAGAALGGFGGLFAGGFIGVQIDNLSPCNCDDPGLMGALIGAPIGAVVGGVLGWVLATR